MQLTSGPATSNGPMPGTKKNAEPINIPQMPPRLRQFPPILHAVACLITPNQFFVGVIAVSGQSRARFMSKPDYRSKFRPSAALQNPYAMAGIGVFAAETDREAELLFTSVQQQFELTAWSTRPA